MSESATAVAPAPTPAPVRGWLRPSQAAEVSGISPYRLRLLALSGAIPRWALLEVGKGGWYRYSAIWCSGEGRGR